LPLEPSLFVFCSRNPLVLYGKASAKGWQVEALERSWHISPTSVTATGRFCWLFLLAFQGKEKKRVAAPSGPPVPAILPFLHVPPSKFALFSGQFDPLRLIDWLLPLRNASREKSQLPQIAQQASAAAAAAIRTDSGTPNSAISQYFASEMRSRHSTSVPINNRINYKLEFIIEFLRSTAEGMISLDDDYWIFLWWLAGGP
jgi:hypothetical protein